jgi:hypothetical protein
MHQVDGLLHKLWTKAVGTEGYVKAEWLELERAILKAADEARADGVWNGDRS